MKRLITAFAALAMAACGQDKNNQPALSAPVKRVTPAAVKPDPLFDDEAKAHQSLAGRIVQATQPTSSYINANYPAYFKEKNVGSFCMLSPLVDGGEAQLCGRGAPTTRLADAIAGVKKTGLPHAIGSGWGTNDGLRSIEQGVSIRPDGSMLVVTREKQSDGTFRTIHGAEVDTEGTVKDVTNPSLREFGLTDDAKGSLPREATPQGSAPRPPGYNSRLNLGG